MVKRSYGNASADPEWQVGNPVGTTELVHDAEEVHVTSLSVNVVSPQDDTLGSRYQAFDQDLVSRYSDGSRRFNASVSLADRPLEKAA